jgi:hypothetical protein
MRRKLSIFGAAVLLAACAFAYDAIEFSTGACAVGATNTVTQINATGKIVYYSFYCEPTSSGTTSTVAVTSLAAKGSTVGASRIIASETITTVAASSNLATAVYVWNDTLTFTVVNTGTNAITSSKGILILEKP